MSIVPRTYEAPGLFSTTNGWPICCDICWRRMRISTSGEPPGADGMMKRIGFSGYAAWAGKASAAARTRRKRITWIRWVDDRRSRLFIALFSRHALRFAHAEESRRRARIHRRGLQLLPGSVANRGQHRDPGQFHRRLGPGRRRRRRAAGEQGQSERSESLSHLALDGPGRLPADRHRQQHLLRRPGGQSDERRSHRARERHQHESRSPLTGGTMTRIALALVFAAVTAAAWSADEADWVVRDFKFHTGEVLPELKLHYTSIGAKNGEPVVVLHGTTQSGAAMLSPAFGGELFGPGQPLDASRYYIILPDSIGHGKSSKPSDGLGMKFPQYNYDDMVNAHQRLVAEHLGFKRVRLVIGNSQGGMHTWLWAEKYPRMMDIAVPMASQPVEMASRNWILRRLIIDSIKRDPGNAQFA